MYRVKIDKQTYEVDTMDQVIGLIVTSYILSILPPASNADKRILFEGWKPNEIFITEINNFAKSLGIDLTITRE